MATTVKLLSSDSYIFEVDIETVKMSTYIMKRLELLGFEEVIIVPPPEPMAGVTLKKVIQWMEHHRNDPVPPKNDMYTAQSMKNVSDWDLQFFNDVDPVTLLAIVRIATSLEIKALIDVTKKIVAKKLAGKTGDQMIAEFNFLPNDENLRKLGTF